MLVVTLRLPLLSSIPMLFLKIFSDLIYKCYSTNLAQFCISIYICILSPQKIVLSLALESHTQRSDHHGSIMFIMFEVSVNNSIQLNLYLTRRFNLICVWPEAFIPHLTRYLWPLWKLDWPSHAIPMHSWNSVNQDHLYFKN